MNAKQIEAALRDLPLASLRYYEQIGSTNDVALAWATEGAADFSLVVADEQTTGRGRAGRKWYTASGATLAFSLILHPRLEEQVLPALFSGLGALALAQTIRKSFRLTAQIKWPNDVLLQGRKLAGVLVEATWLGEQIESLILGMGVNVSAAALPPAEKLDFPATSLEDVLKQPVDRLPFLHDLLADLIEWRLKLGTKEFLEAWEKALAYRGEQVQIWTEDAPPLTGELLGLESDGALRLKSPQGRPLSIHFGDVRLRPVEV